MDSDIQVSVLCLAYNHEAVIRRCLDSLVMQQTSFPFEVVIHDDASTDRTADIIREYAENHPDIIKPILQTENQYSQGIEIFKAHIVPRAQGRFFAFCEGDDYWTDPEKLQKQYDFLSTHPDYTICTHNAVWHDIPTGREHLFPGVDADREYSANEAILGGGNLFATNSIMVRRDAYVGMPPCFDLPGVSDYQIVIYASICGRCMCLREVMSVYNFAGTNSWTASMASADAARQAVHNRNLLKMLRAVDEYYDHQYHDALSVIAADTEFPLLVHDGQWKEALSEKYRPNRKKRPLRVTLYLIARVYFPHLYALIKGRPHE